MTRLNPHRIQDKFYLSYLLEQYLTALETSPMQVRLSDLAYDSRIAEPIFRRLMALQHHPEDAEHIQVEDFHIVFSNILFRYPTVKMWGQPNGDVFIEL
jgi:hypothetical protein